MAFCFALVVGKFVFGVLLTVVIRMKFWATRLFFLKCGNIFVKWKFAFRGFKDSSFFYFLDVKAPTLLALPLYFRADLWAIRFIRHSPLFGQI